MSEDKDQQEPSMEEVLASIRRILSEEDDERGAQAAPAEPASAPEPDPEPAPEARETPEAKEEPEEDEVLELTEEMLVKEEEKPSPAAPQPEPRPEPWPAPRPEAEADALVSRATEQASIDALSELAQAVSRDRGLALGEGRITLEELVRETLRPLLKNWLDANLPYVVERLVKAEIERISRGIDSR